jgi:tRNA threonylcarbamoyladenosine biosynthesis protein TsaB
MIVLAVETSTLKGSIALLQDDRALVEFSLQVEETHSSQLLPAIEYVLEISGVTPGEIDAFAVAAGPGSFTGLRIGMAAMKGLAAATEKPIVGVSTLEAMAWNFPFSQNPLCPMIDARMKEVYCAWFRFEAGTIRRLAEDRAVAPEKVIEDVKEPCIFFGSGALRYRQRLLEALGERALFPPEEIMGARASLVGLLALKRLRAGESDDLASIEPSYIRHAQAVAARKDR